MEIVWTFVEMWVWFFIMSGFWVLAAIVAEPLAQAFFMSLSGLAFVVGLFRLFTRILGWFGFRLFSYDRDILAPVVLLLTVLVIIALVLT